MLTTMLAAITTEEMGSMAANCSLTKDTIEQRAKEQEMLLRLWRGVTQITGENTAAYSLWMWDWGSIISYTVAHRVPCGIFGESHTALVVRYKSRTMATHESKIPRSTIRGI